MEISRTIYAAGKHEFDPVYTYDVVYAKREKRDLTMQILTPIRPDFPLLPKENPNLIEKKFMEAHKKEMEEGKEHTPSFMVEDSKSFPLIVMVPGSGWAGADGHDAVTKLVDLARAGYVVASISYRGTFKDDVRFPAAVQDTKEAIRFLRSQADIYHIDVDRVGLMGDSSGGHTAATAAFTGKEEEFNIGEHLEERTDVKACCLFYAPNDLLNLVQDRIDEGKHLRPDEGEYPFEAWEIFQEDFYDNARELLFHASPINYIEASPNKPPVLFLNGDDDPIIPMKQGLRFCEKVRECGGRAEFVKIAGAGHGKGCWGKESIEIVKQFFDVYL
ncbi:MAG: alpha/beta fold hydrolase [Roseburia sp.]